MENRYIGNWADEEYQAQPEIAQYSPATPGTPSYLSYSQTCIKSVNKAKYLHHQQ